MENINFTKDKKSNKTKIILGLVTITAMVGLGIILTNLNSKNNSSSSNLFNQNKSKYNITNEERNRIIKALSGNYQDYKDNSIVANNMELKYMSNPELSSAAYDLSMAFNTKEPELILFNSTGIVEKFIGQDEFNRIKTQKLEQIKERAKKRDEIINLLESGLYTELSNGKILEKSKETNLAIDKIISLIDSKECEDVFFSDKTFKKITCDKNNVTAFEGTNLKNYKFNQDRLVGNSPLERDNTNQVLLKYYESNNTKNQ